MCCIPFYVPVVCSSIYVMVLVAFGLLVLFISLLAATIYIMVRRILLEHLMMSLPHHREFLT